MLVYGARILSRSSVEGEELLGIIMLKVLNLFSDDILLLISSTDEIHIIQETFQNNSVLYFTD